MTKETAQATVVNFEWARTAFVSAHGRFQTSLKHTDEQHVWISLGETLFWVSALNDAYKGLAATKAERAALAAFDTDLIEEDLKSQEKRENKAASIARAKGIEAYEKYRNDDRHGRAVTGLAIPRNSVVHALGNVVIGRPADADLFWQPTFVSFEQMNLDRKQNAFAQDVLERSSNRPVRYLLRDANYFFIRRQNELDGFMDALTF